MALWKNSEVVLLNFFHRREKFRADSRCSCHESNVNVVFSLFNKRECMEKG